LTQFSVLSVKGSILRIEGLLCELFPSALNAKSLHLQVLFLDTLAHQFKTSKSDMPVIAGCFRGLTSYLESFSKPFEAAPANVQKLYRFVCLCIDDPEKLTRYDIPKAVCKLIASHAVLLRKYERARSHFTNLLPQVSHGG
jgi:hypothetical protein